MATVSKSPPSRRVAEVITTVLSESSLSRIGPQTWSGATHSRGGIRLCPPLPGSVSHSTSASEPAAIRSAVANTSCTDPRAWVRPASPSPPAPASASLGKAERHARAASRTSTSASASASGTVSKRPGSLSAMAALKASPASARSSAGELSASLPSTKRRDRRAARSTSAANSSSVAAWVTRATTSWASSTTTTS